MSIGLSDTVRPLGLFPVMLDTDGYSGFRVCGSVAERNAIPISMLNVGMWVLVRNENIVYSLQSGSVWAPILTVGGVGVPAVNAVALKNISISSPDLSSSTWDNVSLQDGYRLLVPFNTNTSENAIYVKSGSAITKTSDLANFGTSVPIIAGDFYGGDSFIQTNINTSAQKWIAQEGPNYAAPITTLAAGNGGWTDWLTLNFSGISSNYLIDISVSASAFNTNNSIFVSREVRSAVFQAGLTLNVIDSFDFITAPDSPALFKMKPLTNNSSVTIQVWQDPSIVYSYRMSADTSITRIS
jgi:hypothetical protein